MPPVPAPGVPLSTPAGLRPTPFGKAPVSVKVIAVGKPVAVTGNEPSVPTVKVVLGLLVKTGAWSTVCDTDADVLALKFESPL